MGIHSFFPSKTFKFLLIVIFINILSTELAITEDNLEEPKVRKVATPAHFVLVHGACFGGWSWYKVRSLLESVGHKVSSPDLISAGIQPSDPNSLHSFQEYNKPIHDILANLPQGEKVIIVGHSAGGISVTDAIRNYPEKVDVGVYTVGQMQRMGSYFHTKYNENYMQGDSDNFEDVYDFFYGDGPENPPTSGIFKKEARREKIYQLAPLEDATLAGMLLKPCPFRAMNNISQESKYVDEVPRVYIRTLHDNLFPVEKQDGLIKSWPPADVYSVPSDHCPMFSTPFELFQVLHKIAATYSTNFNPKENIITNH